MVGQVESGYGGSEVDGPKKRPVERWVNKTTVMSKVLGNTRNDDDSPSDTGESWIRGS